MELTNSFKNLISGQTIICKTNYKKEKEMEDSPLRNSIKIQLGKVTNNKCFCGNKYLDSCTNCDKRLCEEHAYPIFKSTLGSFTLFNICNECRDVMIEESIKQNGLNKIDADKLRNHFNE